MCRPCQRLATYTAKTNLVKMELEQQLDYLKVKHGVRL